MKFQRKNVFTFNLDPSKGETPALLMTAIALAAHDCALRFDEGTEGSLSAAEAAKFVIRDGREIVMGITAGRACMLEVFATRMSATSVELLLTMYDGDCDALVRRADTRMKELALANLPAQPKIFVDIHDMLGEERPEDLLEFLENSVYETTPPEQLRAIA